MPPSTRSWQSRSYSSWEPSVHSTAEGWQRAVISSTHLARSGWLVVVMVDIARRHAVLFGMTFRLCHGRVVHARMRRESRGNAQHVQISAQYMTKMSGLRCSEYCSGRGQGLVFPGNPGEKRVFPSRRGSLTDPCGLIPKRSARIGRRVRKWYGSCPVGGEGGRKAPIESGGRGNGGTILFQWMGTIPGR